MLYLFKRMESRSVLITDLLSLFFTLIVGIGLSRHNPEECSKEVNLCRMNKACATFLFFLFIIYIGSVSISFGRTFGHVRDIKEENIIDEESLRGSDYRQVSDTYPDNHDMYSDPSEKLLKN